MSWQPPLPEPPGAGRGDPLPSPPVPAIQTQMGPAYATFWRRFFARFLDGLLVGIPTFVVLVSILSDLDPEVGITVAQRDRLFSVGLVTQAISAVYEISLVALRGQTVGKMALGIKVVPVEGSGSVGWGRSAIRWLVPNAVGRLPGVGSLLELVVWLWMLWDPMRQGLHDKAARTVVIRLP
jgi:uncharacterized RDD family membrane protein YckC